MKKDFEISYNESIIFGNAVLAPNSERELLIVPDAFFGYDSDQMLLFRSGLVEQGVSSYLFDVFPKQIEESQKTTANYLDRLLFCIGKIPLKRPFNTLGIGVGAYCSVKLLEQYDIQQLLLASPLIPPSMANDIVYSDEFLDAIAQPQSWFDSDIWGLLRAYKGELGVIVSEHGGELNTEAINLLLESSSKATKCSLETLSKASGSVFQSSSNVNIEKVTSIVADF